MRQARILWFAIAVSSVMYAVIAYVLPMTHSVGAFDEAVRRPLVLPLYGAALVCFFGGMLGVGSLRDNPRLGMIVRLALFEAAAIMGLVAAMIAQDWRLYLPTWALALMGFIREWPSDVNFQN